MTRIKRVIVPLLCVLMVFVLSVTAAAIDLGVTGSSAITTDQAYDRVCDYLGLYDADDITGIKSEYSAASASGNMIKLTKYVDTDPDVVAVDRYFLVWADNNGVLQLAVVEVDDTQQTEKLQYCSDPRVLSSGSSSSLAEKGFSDASAFLSLVGEIGNFIINNELCLISLSFVFIARGIRLLRKSLRVTPR